MRPLRDDLEPGIRDAVLMLREHGWNTTCSCEGGAGHAYDKPTIELDLPNTMTAVDEIANLLVQKGYGVFKIDARLMVPNDGVWIRRAIITVGDWR